MSDSVSSSTSTFPVSAPRAWAEVNLDHLRHNYHIAQKQSGGHIMAVLKAGAYGHGMTQIAACLDSLPAEDAPAFLGVASVIEARRLANAGIKSRIYLLGATCDFEREEIVAHAWTPCISSMEEAEDFNRLAGLHSREPLNVHLAVDTGMGRGGFLPAALLGGIDKLDALKNIHIEGIGSHLPSADEDEEFTKAQFQQFDTLVEKLGADRFTYIHLANSAGLLAYQSQYTNLYRPGLMLYGSSPIEHYQQQLKPVLSLKSRVSLVKTLPAGQGVSYGRDTILEKDTRVATIGMGYGDGYPRAMPRLESSVLIRGVRCPLLGRVTMDQIMVDVSALPDCTCGDEVELFGENILVSEVAAHAKTIAWAVLTGITPRVTRVYSPSSGLRSASLSLR